MARQFGGVHPNKQNDKAKVILAASLVFIVLFAALAYVLLSSQSEPPKPSTVVVESESDAEIKMVDVLVPVKEVQPGTALEARMFRKESRPQVGVSNRVVRDFEEIKAHYSRSLIVPGQPLHRDYITSVKPTNVLTANIPEGFRAVTIRVDARTSVEGFVRPGANVDVVWASRIRGKPGITTIVQNAKVLSAERQTKVDNANPGVAVPSTVTLLVTAEDAQKIQLASTTGKLSLSLRGDADAGKAAGSKTITLDDLIGGVKGPRKQENVEGTVTIGGERWLLVDGKLKPSNSRSSQ